MSNQPKARRFADVLRAETAGEDLRDGPHGIHVFAMSREGLLYELGSVSDVLVYQNHTAARAAIDRIKFAAKEQQ